MTSPSLNGSARVSRAPPAVPARASACCSACFQLLGQWHCPLQVFISAGQLAKLAKLPGDPVAMANQRVMTTDSQASTVSHGHGQPSKGARPGTMDPAFQPAKIAQGPPRVHDPESIDAHSVSWKTDRLPPEAGPPCAAVCAG